MKVFLSNTVLVDFVTEEGETNGYTLIKQTKGNKTMKAENINRSKFDQLLKNDIPVLVDYWAPWCGYCRRIGPAYDKIAEQYQGLVEVVKVNIDDEGALAAAEQIEVIPTLVFYKGGKAVDSIVAPESKAMIDQFIQEAMQK